MSDRMIKLSALRPFRHHELCPPNKENIQVMSKQKMQTPIVVREMGEGLFEILGGHDRVAAAKLRGDREIAAKVTDMVISDEDALKWFLRDNVSRKTVGLQPIVTFVLKEYPTWSDANVADFIGCSRQRVQQIRAEDPDLQADERVGKDGRTRQVANIGKSGGIPVERFAKNWLDKIPRVPQVKLRLSVLKDDPDLPEAVDRLVQLREWIDDVLATLKGNE